MFISKKRHEADMHMLRGINATLVMQRDTETARANDLAAQLAEANAKIARMTGGLRQNRKGGPNV